MNIKSSEEIKKGQIVYLKQELAVAVDYQDIPVGIAARDIKKDELIEFSYYGNTKDVVHSSIDLKGV